MIPPGLRLGPPVHKITPSYRRMETPATRLESYRRTKSAYDYFLSTLKPPNQLLVAQIDTEAVDFQEKLKESALRDKVEKQKIFMDVLLSISFYKPSSPEWASLVEICGGKDCANEIAHFLADKTFLATRQPFA